MLGGVAYGGLHDGACCVAVGGCVGGCSVYVYAGVGFTGVGGCSGCSCGCGCFTYGFGTDALGLTWKGEVLRFTMTMVCLLGGMVNVRRVMRMLRRNGLMEVWVVRWLLITRYKALVVIRITLRLVMGNGARERIR